MFNSGTSCHNVSFVARCCSLIGASESEIHISVILPTGALHGHKCLSNTNIRAYAIHASRDVNSPHSV